MIVPSLLTPKASSSPLPWDAASTPELELPIEVHPLQLEPLKVSWKRPPPPWAKRSMWLTLEETAPGEELTGHGVRNLVSGLMETGMPSDSQTPKPEVLSQARCQTLPSLPAPKTSRWPLHAEASTPEVQVMPAGVPHDSQAPQALPLNGRCQTLPSEATSKTSIRPEPEEMVPGSWVSVRLGGVPRLCQACQPPRLESKVRCSRLPLLPRAKTSRWLTPQEAASGLPTIPPASDSQACQPPRLE